MATYNKIMLLFWLIVGIGSLIFVTFKGFTDGFDRWVHYYVLTLIAFMMYFGKKWMMKRMQKHMDYMNNKQN